MNYVINLNKPVGITSQQAVTRVKRILSVKKAGHTGTLDPLASGVMLVCLGEATKISRFFLDMDKTYRARVKLGERTDTYDAEGRVTETADISCLEEGAILDTVRGFRGAIEQTPPMYSALKRDGLALYSLARRGIEVDRQARAVNIYDISVNEVDLPYFDMTVSCSKGTYIRSLCDDIGQKLGVWAHLSALERLSVGRFAIAESLTFEQLAQMDVVPDGRSVFSIDSALPSMPAIMLDEEECRKARHGQRIPVAVQEDYGGELAKLKSKTGDLIGFGRIESGMIIVERILNL